MRYHLFILLLVSGTVHSAPFANGNAENGRKLFARYECDSCHKGKVGGDGSTIFTRPDRIVRTVTELVPRIKFCSGVVGANLSAQEEQDLASYLNRNYYHFM